VDDEQGIRLYLSRLLQANGYSTSCAGDGAAARLAVEADHPDLITLDLSMPETSRVRFYRELRDNPASSHIPVIFITGVTGPGGARDTERFYATRGHTPPPDLFVGKPIAPAELLEMVGRLLP
jgi:CheY-like chemotaxis protein